MVLCMLLTSCGLLEKVGIIKEKIEENNPPVVQTPSTTDCQHPSTTLKNARQSTCATEGYTGDKVCTSCGVVVEKGTKLPLSTEHGRVKTRNAKAATCVTEGYTGDQVCTLCGTILERGTTIAVAEHVADNGTTTKVPTCISTGIITYSCKGCGMAMDTETLPTVDHDSRYHDMLDGTHNHTCSTCILSENEEHSPAGEGVHFEASCDEGAYTQYTCKTCNGKYKVYDEGSEPVGHTYGEWKIVDATCVADGYKVHDCTVCGKSEVIVIEKTPDVHEYVFYGYQDDVAPTCGEGATEVYVCKDCNVASYTKVVPATGAHTYGDPVTGDDGWTRKTCTECEHEVSSFDASKLKEEGVDTSTIPTDVPLSVTNDTATMEFPTTVIDQFKGGANVKIDAGVITGEEKQTAIDNATNLSDDAKERLKSVELYDFNVTVDGSALSDNFSDAVTVTIPYTLKQLFDENGDAILDEQGNPCYEDKDGIIIWYVGADGSITEITNVQYNEQTGTVTFLAPHFSMYAVAYEETQEMKCRRGYHDYAVIATVEASCSTFGFSTLKCTCCNRITIDYIVEKKLHTYGDVIPAQPTCDSGAYDHMVCEVCGDVLNIKYYRELGHKLDAQATCTTGSYCSVCDKVVVAPLGHVWSEWRVVVSAGVTTNGLRVRNCLRCGETQESETASTGDITALEFESYDELIEAIYDLVVSVDKASVEFSFDAQGYGLIGVTALVDRSGEDMLMLVTYTIDGEEAGMVYYKNGVALLQYAGEYGNVSIDSLMGAPIDVAFSYMEAYYNLLSPYVEMGITSIREQLSFYIDLAGEEVNAILAAAGIPYTAEDLLALLDSIETVYAYASLKLGYTTGAEMKDGVPIPTKADFVSIITAFMESSQDGRNTTYTTNTEVWVARANAVLEDLAELCEKTIADVLFEKLGEYIADIDPTIEDMDDLAVYLKTKLPGTLKVNEALDVLGSVMRQLGEMTLEDLYALANEIMSAMYGQEVDVEQMLAEYYSLTLNDLVAGMTGEGVTAEDLYEAIATQSQAMTVGEIDMDGGTLNDYLQYVAYELNSLPYDADLSFTVDAYGRLVSLTFDEVCEVEQEDENGNTERFIVQFVSVKITRDSSIRVTKPEVLDPVDVDIQGSIDANGNYVITGVPAGSSLTMGLDGGYYADLDDMLYKNEELSAKFGFDIYTEPEHLWNAEEHVENLIKIGSRYYTYTETYVKGQYTEYDKYVAKLDLFEFLNNPSSILPDETDTPVDYYNGMAVYTSPIGYLVMYQGEWWVCDAYLSYAYDKNSTGVVSERYYIASIDLRYNFRDMFLTSTIELSSMDEYNDIHMMDWYSNIDYNVMINLTINGGNYSFRGVSDADGVKLAYVPYGQIMIRENVTYVVGTETSLSKYDYDSKMVNRAYATVQMNGDKSEMNVELVHLYKTVPRYYVKVADGAYILLDQHLSGSASGNWIQEGKPTSTYIRTKINVSSLETKLLPDGNTMYVVGMADPYICEYSYGELYYGYVKISDNAYVRMYCLEQDGYVVDVVYEGCRGVRYMYFDQLYEVMDYVTVNNGVITVSSELISKLLASSSEPGDYVGIQLMATKSIGRDTYHYLFREFLEFNIESEITLPGHNLSDSKSPFYVLFEGHDPGDKVEVRSYIDENGDLVITGAEILHIETSFDSYFPADPFLEKDVAMSNNTGLDIYSYEYHDTRGSSYIYKNGKYYNFHCWSNYEVEAKTIEELLDNWRIEDMRYQFTIYPDANTPAELHNKMVYNIEVTCIDHNTNNGGSDLVNETMARITVYGFIMDGKLQVLTGAHYVSDSLVTFEGYMPFDEYMDWLEYRVEIDSPDDGEWYPEYYKPYIRECSINGKIQTITRYRITLTEPGYDVSYEIRAMKNEDGKYITSSVIVNEYLFIDEVATELPCQDAVERRNLTTFCNGVYTLANFDWVETTTYYAIKIGDIFYDYDDYSHNYLHQIASLEEFRQQVSNTVRVYRVWDGESGQYRFYRGFVPGVSIRGEDEIIDFVDPSNDYYITEIGVSVFGNPFEEIVYILDETVNPEITEITLSDGKKYYHTDGIGYVKLADNLYVRAVLGYDENGDPYAICLYRRASVWSYVLNGYDLFNEYINRTDYSVTIPREMLDYMRDMPDWCSFVISMNGTTITINYYTLDAMFNGGYDFGHSGNSGDDFGGGDYGDKGYGKG